MRLLHTAQDKMRIRLEHHQPTGLVAHLAELRAWYPKVLGSILVFSTQHLHTFHLPLAHNVAI